MSERIDISGLPKGAVLAALYNASRPLGMGMLQFDPARMSESEGEDLYESYAPVRGRVYFDYLKGRVMKVDLAGDSFDPWLYDRDNGEGAAARAVAAVRAAASGAKS